MKGAGEEVGVLGDEGLWMVRESQRRTLGEGKEKQGTYYAVAKGMGIDVGDVNVVDKDAAGFRFHFWV